MELDRNTFLSESGKALDHIERTLGDLEHDALDVDLAGDVLTLGFADGGEFVINAHSAAGQVWMAAGRTAWHFDLEPPEAGGKWIAKKTDDELMSTVARVVGEKLGIDISL